jgi:hypothetical protein
MDEWHEARRSPGTPALAGDIQGLLDLMKVVVQIMAIARGILARV